MICPEMTTTQTTPRPRLPEWLRIKLPTSDSFARTRNLLSELKLHTVCESAQCPNHWECWEKGTATFMIAGDRCTRACGFCAVATAKPLALDIQGRVRDLELSPLSAYAAKFAGYGIERGKLSVDVHYSVAPDGTLQASNKLVLNQLIFGEAVPGASQHLPVKLAVALLADRNGVIDLDVPLSGSLNDPQFRIWPIVWKIVGNLISKALTSPFHLIAGLVNGSGGADELSNVAFDAGTAHISASAQPVLDKIARALADKPSLRLTVVGTASLAQEQAAIRRDRLNALVLAEKRRAAASAGRDVTAVADVGPDEYPALLKEAYQRLDIRKPRNMVGLRKDLPVPEMEALLLAAMPVTEEAAQALALNRSIAVRDYLTARQLPSDRVFLGASQTAPTAADWQPRAELNLEQH